MLDDSMFQDRGTISSDCLLVGLARGSYIIRMSTKATLVFHDHLQQSFEFCELGALDQPVKIHLLQDVEAGELLAPLILVQSRQHPGNVKFTILSVNFFKAPAPGLTCCGKYGADRGILQSSQALRVVDCCLVTELIVPLMEQILERR